MFLIKFSSKSRNFTSQVKKKVSDLLQPMIQLRMAPCQWTDDKNERRSGNLVTVHAEMNRLFYLQVQVKEKFEEP